MMIKTAGGPGLVSPIDFNERKGKGLSRASWIAIGVVAAAHMAVGVGLYYQRFELAARETTTDPGGIIVEILRPEPKPIPPQPVEHQPRPENLKLNDTPAPSQPTEVLVAASADTAPTGETVTIATPVDHPVPDAKPVPIPTPEQPPVTRVIVNPDWASRPTGDQLMRAYPERALTQGVAGVVTMNCLAEANGRVSGCTVVQETPGSYGFGRAAGGLSRYFRMSPRTVNGAAEGSRVNITLRFVPPAD